MEIGAQIKTRRQDLNMTQEMLAKELHVGRTTVSNWEIGRNYPDLQLIVSISNVLNISLDTLLGKESEIVKEITRDTNIRKSQSRKIKILSALLILVILAGLFGIYKVLEYQDISSPEQIVSLQAYEDRLEITTDLPFYRSVVGYTIGNSPDGNDTIELSLSSQIDLSLDHQQKIVVETDSLEEDMGIRNLKTVDIVDRNGIIKTFDI
ncbi:helix-turn-helix domain-containing protein [Zhenpiania hominis]|uniref:Helix-turn-helix transcriptional regulator n=1 Tax=Zhenpiania hominis TaxID=2763644 RepID=A0A923NNT4_9FIRM|nr:helix-turn-helix transcriptional regulator [Zhenpiania hominis]MBC6681360.1 helix-turn-helix transcriptional regulator [Zhenpiania hominis]